MTDGTAIILPVGEKILHKSELFDALVLDKYVRPGITKDMYHVALKLLENDPDVQRTALVAVAEPDYRSIEVGQTVSIRLYEHESGKWLSTPPIVTGA